MNIVGCPTNKSEFMVNSFLFKISIVLDSLLSRGKTKGKGSDHNGSAVISL